MGMGRGGFCLVELLVVITILGLLFSVSCPAVDRLRGALILKATSRSIAANIRQSEVQALATLAEVDCSPFKIASSGFPQPGYSGTQLLTGQSGQAKKIVLSSVGRVRIE